MELMFSKIHCEKLMIRKISKYVLFTLRILKSNAEIDLFKNYKKKNFRIECNVRVYAFFIYLFLHFFVNRKTLERANQQIKVQ